MGRKRGSGLIVALGVLLGQVSTWALVGVSLPGCEMAETRGCGNGSDCRPDEHCETGACVPGPTSNIPPSTPPSTPPGQGGDLDVQCNVHPDRGRIPRTVRLEVLVNGGDAPYQVRWDLGDSGTVTTYDEFVDKEIIRPLQTVSAAVTDTGTPPRTGTCQVDVDFDPPTLQVGCSAAPTSGVAPLDVQFTADPEGCIGPCTFTWDFGDGSPLAPARNPAHTYGGGDYNARVTLTDAVTSNPPREGVCTAVITVSGPPTPSGSPSPPPGGNHAPSVASITAGAPVCVNPSVATSTIQCQVVDVDGDDVTVTPSASPVLGGDFFTPSVATVPGGSGTATFTFSVHPPPPPQTQTYSITCTPVDEQGLGGQPASTSVTFSCGGGGG